MMSHVLWLLLGCNEIRLFKVGERQDDTVSVSDSGQESNNEPTDDTVTQPSTEPSTEPSSEPSNEPDSAPSSEPSNEYEGPGSSFDNPIMAAYGDVVINELMINPESVGDKNAEWIEVLNLTDMYVDLWMLRLQDNGVDNYAVEEVTLGSMIVEPNGYLLLCANSEFWENGGVDCHGTFLYQTFGGGFGLSNTEDEVILRSFNNVMLDRFDYSEGFSVEGTSLGVDIDYATPSANDDPNEWCEQFGFLPDGDNGTPNAPNTMCF